MGKRDFLTERPEDCRLNTDCQLAQGLVFCGAGQFAQSLHYHDSSLYKNHGLLTNMAVPATATSGWTWNNYLRRWGVRGDGTTSSIFHSSLSLGTSHCISMWYKHGTNQREFWSGALYSYASYVYNTTWYYSANTANVSVTIPAFTTGVYYHLGIKRIATAVSFFMNGFQVGTTQTLAANNALTLTQFMGRSPNWCNTGPFFDPLATQATNWDSFFPALADPSNVMLSGLLLPPRRRLFASAAGAPAGVFRFPWQQRRHRRLAGVR